MSLRLMFAVEMMPHLTLLFKASSYFGWGRDMAYLQGGEYGAPCTYLARPSYPGGL